MQRTVWCGWSLSSGDDVPRVEHGGVGATGTRSKWVVAHTSAGIALTGLGFGPKSVPQAPLDADILFRDVKLALRPPHCGDANW